MDLNGLGGILSMCSENFNSFHTFVAEKRRAECKKTTCLATKGRGLLPRNLETHARKAWVAEIENHHSLRYKITAMFRDLISREFNFQINFQSSHLTKKETEDSSKRPQLSNSKVSLGPTTTRFVNMIYKLKVNWSISC